MKSRCLAVSFLRPLGLALLIVLCGSVKAGPVLLRDINPGMTDTVMSNFFATDDLVFFRASVPPFGSEVWRSDGTPDGTFIVQDLRTGFNQNSSPAAFSRLADEIMFGAVDGTTTGLFVTRGMPDDIFRIKADFVIWQNTTAPLHGELLVSGSEIGALGGDRELWKVQKVSEDTFETMRVKDINPGSQASFPEDMATVIDRTYFRANDGMGEALWQSDGTESGTAIVLASPGDVRLRFPQYPTNVAGRLFVEASSDDSGSELWVVEPGSAQVIDVCTGPCGAGAGGIAAVGPLAYFRSLGNFITDGTTGAELWRSDGTPAGTWKVREIGLGGLGTEPGYISTITDFDGTEFFFLADDGDHGLELWHSDGTFDGTRMVKDINPGPADGVSNVQTEIVVARGQVFFTADDGTHGYELWRSDGTSAGTFMVADLNSAGDAYPGNFSLVGDYLIFTAADVAHGTELWIVEFPFFADDFEGDPVAPIR